MSLSHGFLLFCLCVVALFQLNFTFATSNPSGLTLRAFLDDSPESPLYRIENLTREERIEKLIKITNARVKYLNLVSNTNASVVLPDNIPMPLFREDLFYAVKFALGSQGHVVKLLMDTGSGLTWTQCLPCENCFPQHLPIFDPRASATYAKLPCNHDLCHGQERSFDCVDGECRYRVEYMDGTYTSGVGSRETVHFFTDKSHVQSFDHFIFGCSSDSKKEVFFKNTDISGIFGLDMSKKSIMHQLSTYIRNRFSYCLAPFNDVIPRPLVLRFGDDIPQPQHVQSTLFVESMYNKYYNLELLDISVAGHPLDFPPGTFQVRERGRGGCFIDSGTLFTQIDGNTIGVNAFDRVLQVFEAYYGSRGLTRIETRRGAFELCYNRPNNYNDFAALTFHFNGADYTVDGIYTNGFSSDKFCVAIVRGSYATILGAFHQQNKRIIYDGTFGELQFADEDCIHDIS